MKNEHFTRESNAKKNLSKGKNRTLAEVQKTLQEDNWWDR